PPGATCLCNKSQRLPTPGGPVAWVSLDARGRASSARAREGVQPAHTSGEVRISAPTEPLPWRRSTAILAKPTDHGSQTAKFGPGAISDTAYIACRTTTNNLALATPHSFTRSSNNNSNNGSRIIKPLQHGPWSLRHNRCPQASPSPQASVKSLLAWIVG
ncbi:hypothetical protein BHE90_010632, partial [Fusarium euwallaceae]